MELVNDRVEFADSHVLSINLLTFFDEYFRYATWGLVDGERGGRRGCYFDPALSFLFYYGRLSVKLTQDEYYMTHTKSVGKFVLLLTFSSVEAQQ